ncbi:MAG: orotate phosphoribosyltransferase [Thermoanaerobaculum sp.]
MPAVSLEELAAVGAYLSGHFVLSSGLHSPNYLQCALYLANPQAAEAAGRQLAARLKTTAPNLVVSPALGGIIIGHEVARALGVRFFFTERWEGAMTLRRGFVIPEHARVVVVEDVVTTGGSTREVTEVVTRQGGTVVGVGAIANRSGTENPFAPLPFAALLDVSIPTYPPEACPLCRQGLPLEKPGSRR